MQSAQFQSGYLKILFQLQKSSVPALLTVSNVHTMSKNPTEIGPPRIMSHFLSFPKKESKTRKNVLVLLLKFRSFNFRKKNTWMSQMPQTLQQDDFSVWSWSEHKFWLAVNPTQSEVNSPICNFTSRLNKYMYLCLGNGGFHHRVGMDHSIS